MATAAAASRVMEIVTPLGKDALLFHKMTCEEKLGEMPVYRISVLSTKPDVEAEKLLGKTVTVKLELPRGGPRCFDAMVTRFSLAPMVGRYYGYEIIAHPWLWLLTQTTDCRIFQNKAVPDIVREIFAKYTQAAFEFRLTADYRPWPYCVQYRETDFNFVSRLLEQEGIYYFVKHSEGKHVIVLADSMSAHQASSGYESLPFVASDRAGNRLERESVSEWHFAKEILTGKFVTDDYDFERPSVDLEQNYKLARSHEEASHEQYDYPGEYVREAEGEHFVRTRLESLQCRYEVCQASGNARGLCTGSLFKLTGHPRADQNKEYLLVSTTISFSHGGYEGHQGAGGEGATFSCAFSSINSKEPFRPRFTAAKHLVKGPQTAVVVGPSGDEIYTDKYGRVKVQFHWDRYGKKNENSSCWVRVSQPWAGKNWGFMQVPRIGQEVVVDFLEGDPDQPIITGRVYNAEQMPPWDLPANATQSGVLSRSSKGGSPANANAIRFEDKKGSEQVWIHAEKNQDIEVENDETHWVGHDRTKTIDHDETVHVKHDRTETVDHDETITIGNDRTEKVMRDQTETILRDQSETILRNRQIQVAMNHSEQIGAAMSVVVGSTLTETVGANYAETVGGAMEITVGAAMAITVGAALAESVGGTKTESIGGSRTESVGGNRTLSVAKDSTEAVNGAKSVAVQKDLKETVAGQQRVEVQKEYMLQAKKVQITADDEINLKTGSAEIVLKKDGSITIKGNKISIKGDGDVVIKGSKITEN